jgi:nucleotide-binding universal stress UspA family protein
MSRFRRILHPSDFSRASRAAFAKAVELAKSDRAELVLVHVLGPILVPAEAFVPARAYEDMWASARAKAQELGALAGRAKQAGVRATTVLVEGSTATAHEEIARAARRKRADLIVMGTHGRTGIARVFLGSVASRVVATSPCPVLTVRGR